MHCLVLLHRVAHSHSLCTIAAVALFVRFIHHVLLRALILSTLASNPIDPSQPTSMNQSSLVHKSSQSHKMHTTTAKKYNSHAPCSGAVAVVRAVARPPPLSVLFRVLFMSRSLSHNSCSFSLAPLFIVLFFLSRVRSLSSHLHSLSQPCHTPRPVLLPLCACGFLCLVLFLSGSVMFNAPLVCQFSLVTRAFFLYILSHTNGFSVAPTVFLG